ncbi:cupin domain-containing protein [Pseudoxanthomonas sp. 10H]|uniref:cupin domain-containing protein n=1 Tax=Pseudoxanthomonas sp. 10H TaxID=3242729 RepID=UPI003558D07B
MAANPSRAPRALFHHAHQTRWLDPFPGESMGVRITTQDAGGGLALIETVVAPMGGPPLHIHHDADETFYVLTGTLHFACGDRREQVVAGSVVHVPRGVPHAFRNFGAHPARMLALFTPGGFDRLVQLMDRIDIADLPRVASLFDAEIVGGPIDDPVSGEA